jgi:DNA repair protein RadC
MSITLPPPATLSALPPTPYAAPSAAPSLTSYDPPTPAPILASTIFDVSLSGSPPTRAVPTRALPAPASERPRERCLENGAQALSLRECLAVILGSGPPGAGSLGLATRILTRPGPGLNRPDEERAFFTAMENSGLSHLVEIPGLGPAGKARLLAAFEIGRRYANYRQTPVRQAPASLDELATQALTRVTPELRNEAREWLGFVCLHRSGELGELCVVERGVRTHVNVDPAELFARLLALRPRGFVLIHNHPSGNVNPSPEDLHLTRNVDDLARSLGMRLLGHWIVSPSGEHWLRG